MKKNLLTLLVFTGLVVGSAHASAESEIFFAKDCSRVEINRARQKIPNRASFSFSVNDAHYVCKYSTDHSTRTSWGGRSDYAEYTNCVKNNASEIKFSINDDLIVIEDAKIKRRINITNNFTRDVEMLGADGPYTAIECPFVNP
jgi:hypothetical protein